MLEMLLSPRRAEKRSWEMLIVGLFYGSLSVLLVTWIFASDSVLSKYSGILLITFSVMFSIPFMYFLIRNEEEKDMKTEGMWKMMKQHKKPLLALMWLFLGFVIAFAFWYIILGSSQAFKAQIETYCYINRPSNFDSCLSEYGLTGNIATGKITSQERLFTIFSNNIYVLIFTLVFSLIFGAGAIFVLAWNASVIAVAIGIFTKFDWTNMIVGIARYMIHGFFEIGAYFVGALAGGVISIAVIRHDTKSEKFWDVLQDSLNLIILAIILLVLGALIEVYITPVIFG